MHSTDLTTSSTAIPPRRIPDFRQVSATVYKHIKAWNLSWFLKNGSSEISDFRVFKFKNKRCKTCPKLEIKSFFYSNVTGNKRFIINTSFKNIICHTSNIIYVVSLPTKPNPLSPTPYLSEKNLILLSNIKERSSLIPIFWERTFQEEQSFCLKLRIYGRTLKLIYN